MARPTLEDLIAKRDSIKHNKRLDRQFKREANMPKTTNTKPASKTTTPAPSYDPAMDLFRKNNATAKSAAVVGWNAIANYKDRLCVVASFQERDSNYGQAFRYHALFLADMAEDFVDCNSPYLAADMGKATMPLIGQFTQKQSKNGRPVWTFEVADVDTLPDLVTADMWTGIKDFVKKNAAPATDNEIPF